MADDPTDLAIRKRQTPPYYWPDANMLMQMFLSVSIVLMVSFILHQLLTGKVALDTVQNNLLLTLFGFILGCFKDVFGYAFGSSAGQKRQGEVITKSLEDKDKIIAGNVAATAAVAAVAAGDHAPATIITTAPADPSVTPTITTVTTPTPQASAPSSP